MTAPESLPNADRATVSVQKLRDYALSAHHPVGVHKARVFAAALGIRQEDWEFLRSQILDGIRTAPASKAPATAYGERYRVTLQIVGRNGRIMPVTTAWFIPNEGEAIPQLTTIWVDVP
ncbi:MAG: DUF6883 domain-containing protein [Dehalococcoidia bacterium]